MKLTIPFHGVDYAEWDPEVHDTYLTREGKENLMKVTRAVRDSPEARIKIKGLCGPPAGPKMVSLATKRTHVVQEYLKERGCRNEISISPLGFELSDKKGPRCEVEVVQEEVREAIVEAPPPCAKPYLSVSFSPERTTKTWFDRPLGFTYESGAFPVRVSKVVKGSRADIFGVKEGMEVQDIEFTGQGKVECTGSSYEDVHGLLLRGTGVLPQESDRPWLRLYFHDPAFPGDLNELTSKVFYTRPLGLTFSPGVSPIRINRIEEGSRAWELGVRSTMQVRAVEFMGHARVDVADKSYEETYSLIVEGTKILRDAA